MKFAELNERFDLSPDGDPDSPLRAALEDAGLADEVELIVGDSRTAPLPPEPYDVVFADGDHSYEGARGDVDRYGLRTRPGGHVLLHDAFPHGGASPCEGVARVVDEVTASGAFERQPDVGSIAHFTRR